MPKNIIFLHLESISNTILWQYRSELETVWRLWRNSLRFTRFHSNATSTLMAAIYLQFGSTAVNDSQSFYGERTFPLEGQFRRLQSSLASGGYAWRGYTLDYFLRRENTKTHWHLYADPDALFANIRDFISESTASGKNFCFYINNQVTHMALDDRAKALADSFSNRFRAGYRSLDASVKRLLATLAEMKALDDALIVGFGDHGDEMWSHGLNRGYCHGIPPYGSLTWTPLFIHNCGLPPGDDDRLIQLIDLGRVALRLAAPAHTPDFELDKVPFGGDDVFSRQNDLIFSQNLYALQLEHRDPEKGMFKGYSVTDGVYRLVASSGGNRPKEGGLEFFCDRIDPANSRNLLDFFTLRFDGTPLEFRQPSEASAGDFPIVFNPAAVRDMMDRYAHMRQRLHDYVRAKEELALKSVGERPYHVMPEKAFTVARKRMRRD